MSPSELRQSEEKFAAAFHASPDLMAITRLSDGTILEVNEAYSRLLGYSRAESIGRTTSDLSIWADPADRATFMAGLEESGQITDFETTLRRKDGTLLTCIDSARTLDVGGETCVLSVIHDVTERKRAEQALLASEARFRRIFEESPIGIVTVAPDFHFLSANEAFCRMLGYEEEELRSLTFAEITHPAHRDEDIEAVQAGRCRDPADLPDGEALPAQGRETCVWGAATITPVRDQEGQLLYFLTMVEDISERKRAEAELRQSEQRLTLATQAAKLGVFDFDISSGVHRWDARTRELWGVGPNEPVSSDTLFAGIHPDDRERVQAAMDRDNLSPGHSSFAAEYRVINRADGVEHWVSVSGATLYEDERPTRMVGFVQEITRAQTGRAGVRRERRAPLSHPGSDQRRPLGLGRPKRQAD